MPELPEPCAQNPGTVSQILWHFTGGPAWDEATERQANSRKSAPNAYNALVGILESRELRVGNYKEVVRVRVEKVRTYDRKAKKYKVEHDVLTTLRSAPVCCLADIPIMHLAYHADRYGKFAIGFHRAAALRAGFNPVFYTVHDSAVIRTIREGFATLQSASLDFNRLLLEEVTTRTEEAELQDDVEPYLTAMRSDADDLESSLQLGKASIEQFLAFVKTLEADEFHSIYCEREWRSVETFNFTYDDVAMIVLPQNVTGRAYFTPFVTGRARTLGLPRAIPIVPWETLVES